MGWTDGEFVPVTLNLLLFYFCPKSGLKTDRGDCRTLHFTIVWDRVFRLRYSMDHWSLSQLGSWAKIWTSILRFS